MTNNHLQNITQKIKIEQLEPHWKPGVNSGASEWFTVPAPLMTPNLHLWYI